MWYHKADKLSNIVIMQLLTARWRALTPVTFLSLYVQVAVYLESLTEKQGYLLWKISNYELRVYALLLEKLPDTHLVNDIYSYNETRDSWTRKNLEQYDISNLLKSVKCCLSTFSAD